MDKRIQFIFNLGFGIWDLGFQNPKSEIRNPKSRVRGMTLLELMLALALSALLMIAIGMAIDLHLRALDSRRTSVEEAQLARAVLRSFEKDIRDSVQFETIDFSVVEQLAVGTAINQVAGALAGGGTGLPGAAGQPGTGQGSGGQNSTGQDTSAQNNSTQSNGGRGGATGSGGSTGTGGTQSNSGRSTSSTGNSGGGNATTQANASRTTGGTGGGTSGTGQTGSRSTTGTTSGGAASMQSGSRSAMGGTAGVGTSGLGVAGADGQTSGEGTNTEDIAGATGVASIPGLYGNQYELQIDVSRLPRLDEYSSLMNMSAEGTSAARMPSDVKTVAYYLKTQDDTLTGAGQTTLGGPRTGLVRRELDRAVTSWAIANGGSDDLVSAEKVLASEVTSLEFQYYDGESWATSWDSDVKKGLPVAIEILMGIASSQSRARQRLENGGVAAAFVPADDDLVYRLVVKLPVGKPTFESTTTEESTDPAATESGTTPGATAPTGGAGT